MKDDLIRRKTLTEEIESLRITITGLENGKKDIFKLLEEYKKSVLNCIEDAPTAYDSENIINGIENLCIYHDYKTDEDGYFKEYCDEVFLKKEEVLDVVRSGGLE